MKQKIRVLHIIKSLGRGGAETLLPETLKVHDKDRFEFFYIYFLPWKDQLVEEIKEGGGEVFCFEASNNLKLLSQYKSVIRFCKEKSIDIIHCHLPWAGFLGRIVFQSQKIPVVYSEHNLQDRYHIATRLINKYSFNHQSMAFGVSQDVTNSIQKNIHPSIPVKTIPNGVNTEKYKRTGRSHVRKEYGIPEEAVVIGIVAVFRFQKRLKEWLKVFSEFSKGPQKIYGIIVGAGPLEKEIKEEHAHLNLDGKVFFAGLQTNPRPFYEEMDIFMMTSSFEGLPIALLEAMSMECAIVSTDAGGIKEVVRNERDGLLCPVDRWDDMPAFLEKINKHEELLKQYKTAARKRVVEEFSLKKMVAELEKNYLNIVRNGNKIR